MGWIAGRVYRQKITIQEGNVFADHTDFPVAIKITGSNEVFTKAQSDGYDILFANDAEEILSYERVRWDPGSQILVVYVKTDLSSSESTEFYMYYGNGGHTITTDGQDATGVWASHYKGVYHFEEASGQLQDSTSNARNSTTVNQVKYRYGGLHSYACYFDGSGDYAILPSSLSIGGNAERTVTAYFYPEWAYNQMGTWSPLFRLGGDSSQYRSWIMSLDNGGECSPSESIGLHYWASNTCTGERVVTSGDEILTSTWHQYAGIHNGSTTQRVFLNGTQRGTSGYTLNSIVDVSYIAYRPVSSVYYRGRLSEIRVSSTDLGSEWVRTEYENMINNDTFFTLSAEEDTPYLIEDIPTAVTIYDDANSIYGTRNYLTEFTLQVASTTYYDMPVDVSLADIVQTTSGTDDIDVELGLSASGIATDAELDTDVDFYVSNSGIFNTDVRNTVLDFTVGREPVPVTDPYGGIDVRDELGIGHIVTPSGYGEDVDIEFVVGTAFDTETDLDVDFFISTSQMFDYIADTIASTVSGTYGWAAYRQRITISGSKIEGDLDDFPVLVYIDDIANTVFTKTTFSGAEVKFKKDNEWLDHEMVNFDAASPELHAYVKCTLTSGIDYTFYMYYGDYGQIEDSAGTWNNSFEAVYHMEEDPTGGVIIDSTEANNATPGGGMDASDLVTSATTELSKALDFDGNDDYLNAGTFNPSSTDLTLEFVYRLDQLASTLGHSHHVIAKRDSWSPTEMMWQIHVWNNDDTIAFATNTGWVASNEGRFTYTPPATTWQYIAITHDDGGLDTLYVDGDFQESHSAITFDSDTDAAVIIGNANVGGSSATDGRLDEMRISSVVRPPGWIKTTYNNIMDNANFFSELGVNEEFTTCGGVGDEVNISGWVDTNYSYRQKITINSSTLSSSVSDFPLAIKVDTGNDLFNVARSDGYDIIFTEEDGETVLDYERSIYDGGAENFQAFVKTDLSSSTNTIIYMYYGYAHASDQSTGSAAWDSNFDAVWHFEDGTYTGAANEVQDSSGNGKHGRASGGVQGTDDVWGQSLNVVDSNDYARFESNLDIFAEYTISCLFWIPLSNSTSWHTLTRGSQYHQIILRNDHVLGNYQAGFHSSGFDMDTLAAGLHHVAVVRLSAGTGDFYVDGAFVGNASLQPQDDIYAVGNYQGNGQHWGQIDEFRVSASTGRSASWIKAEYESLVNYDTFYSFGSPEEPVVESDHPSHWCLADHFETDVTVSGALSYPINVDVYASVSGIQYNYLVDCYAALANTTPSGLPLDPLISGSYFSSDVTTSGGLSYPLETDLYVSLANSVSGQVPIPPSINHTSDYTVASGGYFSTDMRLHALQIDNFFLDVDEYVTSTATMYVDITDKRRIPIDTANCYFIIDGVPVTSGIWFTPVDRPTASGYRMYYDPPGDFAADDSIEVIVHAENVINDTLEQVYYLLWGYNLIVNATELHSWGWDKEVIVWSTATNLARCPAESADAWHIRTAPKPSKDLAASIVPQVKHKDLSAVIYPISTAIFYDGMYKITVNLKDSAGNEMPPFTLEFTVEDKPN